MEANLQLILIPLKTQLLFWIVHNYTEDDGDVIEPDHAIYWRTSEGSLAGFSKPGGMDPDYLTQGEYLRNRSKLYNDEFNKCINCDWKCQLWRWKTGL